MILAISVCSCSVKDYYFLKRVLNLCAVISVLEVGIHLYSELLGQRGRGILCPLPMQFFVKTQQICSLSYSCCFFPRPPSSFVKLTASKLKLWVWSCSPVAENIANCFGTDLVSIKTAGLGPMLYSKFELKNSDSHVPFLEKLEVLRLFLC